MQLRRQLTWLAHSFPVSEDEVAAWVSKYFSDWPQPSEIVLARPALWLERFSPFGQYVRSTRAVRLFSLRECGVCKGKAYVLRTGWTSKPHVVSKDAVRDLYFYDVIPHEYTHAKDHLRVGTGFKGGSEAELSAVAGAKNWRQAHGFPEQPWYASERIEDVI